MTNNNYTRDEKDPLTGQKRVTIHHDMNAVLFDDTNPDHTVPASGSMTSAWQDISADAENTLFIACTLAFTFRVQLTDDTAANPDAYDYCDGDGNVISFSCTAAKKAIPISAKARQLRVIATNGGATNEAPYVGLM